MAGPLCPWLLVVSVVALVVARGQDQERDRHVQPFHTRATTGAGFVAAYVEDVFKTEGRLAVETSPPDARTADFAESAELLGFPAAVLPDNGGWVAALARGDADRVRRCSGRSEG